MKESGFATPLVILSFAAVWVFPVISSIVGGDLFSAEDRHGTWKTVLTRSRSRGELFAAKVLVAQGFSMLAVAVLALSSIAAGVLFSAPIPSSICRASCCPRRSPCAASCFAWASVLPPLAALTGVAVMVSVVTRSSAAGIGLPVLAALTMQLGALMDAPEAIRRWLVTSAFEVWHAVLIEPRSYQPIVDAGLVCAAYLSVSLGIAYRALRRRDIGG